MPFWGFATGRPLWGVLEKRKGHGEVTHFRRMIKWRRPPEKTEATSD